MEIGYLTAFLGGALALLSPCGALLLPSFFASTVGTRGRLLVHGTTFYLGLTLTLVPLGLGAALMGSLFAGQRGLLVVTTGVLIIVFGVMQVFGFGFDLSRLVPGAGAVAANAGQRRGILRTFLLGTVSGLAGFCAGPILGAVLSLAAAQGSALVAGTMLAVYAAGMVVPMVGLAAIWFRLGAAGRSRLRGRGFIVGRRQFHTTSVVTGFVLVAVGSVFLATNGLIAVPDLVPARALFDAQVRVASLGAAIPDLVAIVTAALVALGVWFLSGRRARSQSTREAEPQLQDQDVRATADDARRPGGRRQ